MLEMLECWVRIALGDRLPVGLVACVTGCEGFPRDSSGIPKGFLTDFLSDSEWMLEMLE